MRNVGMNVNPVAVDETTELTAKLAEQKKEIAALKKENKALKAQLAEQITEPPAQE